MKRYGNLYGDIISFENLLLASKKAFRGKLGKRKVAEFYFELEKELLRLREELLNKTYEPRPLRTFLIFEPKEREIGASDFRDRVVHHAICNIIEPIFERSFIYHSYACREGKGTHRAIRQAQVFSRKYRYFLKCDIRKYFASIDHDILKEMLSRKFKDPDLLWLLFIIIDSSTIDSFTIDSSIGSSTIISGSDVKRKGLPIGSLTSQQFANLYLDRLDHYIKDSLGVKAYLRYMDDFILFSDEKSELHLLHAEIRSFLKRELKLELKEKETVLAPMTEGIPFLGFRIFPNLIRLKHENKKRALKKIKLTNEAFNSGKLDEDEYARSLMSSTEHLKSGSTYRLRKDIFGKMFF